MREIIKSSKKIRRKKLFEVLSLLLCSFLLVFIYLGYISRMNIFMINKIEIEGNIKIQKEDILKIAEENLSGRYFFIFPKNNFLIYPDKKIAESIKSYFPRVEEVYSETRDIDILRIIIKEREPAFIWSSGKDDGTGDFYADKDGLIFEKAPKLSEGVFFRIEGLSEKATGGNYLSKNIIDKEKLAKLIKFKDEANRIVKKNINIKWQLASVFIGDGGDFDFIVSDGEDKKWEMKITARDEISIADNKDFDSSGVLKTEDGDNTAKNFNGYLINTARNLETVVLSEFFKKDNKNGDNLEYIDLRFGKKVFYRFNDARGYSNSSTAPEVL